MYGTGCRHLRNFLIEHNPNLTYPFRDADWALFYTYLIERVKPATAVSYLSHVAFAFETTRGVPRPTWELLPILSRVKRGSRKVNGVTRKRKFPVTYELACRIIDKFDMRHDTVSQLSGLLIFIVILIVGITGFFRLGELVPKDKKYHPEKLVRRGQISFFRPAGVTPYARIWLYRSKGDRFSEGVPIFIPANTTSTKYCPVAWLQALLRVSSTKTTHPIFTFPNGSLVLRGRFVKWLKLQIKLLGLDSSMFSGHSLRIGAAVSASRRGLSDDLIKRLGRWRSDAYLLYTKYTPLDVQKLRDLISQLNTVRSN